MTPDARRAARTLRIALLIVLFCVVLAFVVLHARYSLVTIPEMRAYWLGRNGHFVPFSVLWRSEALFGGTTFAMRLPLVILFALGLAIVLRWLYRIIPDETSPLRLIGFTALFLALIGIQQTFSLRKARAAKRSFMLLRDHLERSIAPDETLVVEGVALALPLHWYGSPTLREQLAINEPHSAPDIPALPFYAVLDGQPEFVYLGTPGSVTKNSTKPLALTIHRDDTLPDNINDALPAGYRARNARIYFVAPASPATAVTPTAQEISSKP